MLSLKYLYIFKIIWRVKNSIHQLLSSSIRLFCLGTFGREF